MQCKYIITGVERLESAPGPAESFFVVTFAPGEQLELQQEFARLSFDLFDAETLVNVIFNDSYMGDFALLISLDGKRGKLRPGYGGNVELYSELEELVPFLKQDHGEWFGVEGGFEKFVACLNSEVAENPAKALEYKYLPDPSVWNIPKRFDFERAPEGYGPESLDSEIQAAARNPEAGSDDAIALLYICRDLDLDVLQHDQERIADEVELRLAKKISFRSHFLSFSELTQEELNTRSLRAKWYLQKFKETIAHLGYEEERHLPAMRFLRSLDNDVLAELAVVAFYSGFEMKPVAMVLSERFREPYHF